MHSNYAYLHRIILSRTVQWLHVGRWTTTFLCVFRCFCICLLVGRFRNYLYSSQRSICNVTRQKQSETQLTHCRLRSINYWNLDGFDQEVPELWGLTSWSVFPQILAPPNGETIGLRRIQKRFRDAQHSERSSMHSPWLYPWSVSVHISLWEGRWEVRHLCGGVDPWSPIEPPLYGLVWLNKDYVFT